MNLVIEVKDRYGLGCGVGKCCVDFCVDVLKEVRETCDVLHAVSKDFLQRHYLCLLNLRSIRCSAYYTVYRRRRISYCSLSLSILQGLLASPVSSVVPARRQPHRQRRFPDFQPLPRRSPLSVRSAFSIEHVHALWRLSLSFWRLLLGSYGGAASIVRLRLLLAYLDVQ